MRKARMVFAKDNPGRVVVVLNVWAVWREWEKNTLPLKKEDGEPAYDWYCDPMPVKRLAYYVVRTSGTSLGRYAPKGCSSIFVYHFPPELAKAVRLWAEQQPDVIVEER